MEKSYDEYMKADIGDTDGLATRKPKRGQPSENNEDDNDKHPYLEDRKGNPVNWQWLSKFGDQAQKVFNTLKHASVAPPSWGQLGLNAYEYFKNEMILEFQEFCLWNGAWKLDHWAACAYVSWRQNIWRQEGDYIKKKQKSSSLPQLSMLDDSGLIKMDDLKVNKLDITTPHTDVPATDAPMITVPKSLATTILGLPVQQPATVWFSTLFFIVTDYLWFLYSKGTTCKNLWSPVSWYFCLADKLIYLSLVMMILSTVALMMCRNQLPKCPQQMFHPPLLHLAVQLLWEEHQENLMFTYSP
jgi:hypothetical protein